MNLRARVMAAWRAGYAWGWSHDEGFPSMELEPDAGIPGPHEILAFHQGAYRGRVDSRAAFEPWKTTRAPYLLDMMDQCRRR